MFRLRPARSEDLEPILELAKFLDSPNLPSDRDFLRGRLARSERSFRELGAPGPEREYQFALEDASGRVVGTCVILSKHGTLAMPHTYLRVGSEARHSVSVGVRAEHVTLRLGVCTDGPTELGALILHPDARGEPGWPGKLLSWGRFAFIALHRDCFERQLLAEMRASLDPEGQSAFWEAFGRRFTGMTYDEADRRSARDKQFILDLFPDITFYASLLPAHVTAQLGQVHEETLPAVHLLERAGFRAIGEIDPFDAGPFYGAATDAVLPVRETAPGRVVAAEPGAAARPAIASAEDADGFRAVAARAERRGDQVRLAREALERLGLREGGRVWTTPLRTSGKAGASGD